MAVLEQKTFGYYIIITLSLGWLSIASYMFGILLVIIQIIFAVLCITNKEDDIGDIYKRVSDVERKIKEIEFKSQE